MHVNRQHIPKVEYLAPIANNDWIIIVLQYDGVPKVHDRVTMYVPNFGTTGHTQATLPQDVRSWGCTSTQCRGHTSTTPRMSETFVVTPRMSPVKVGNYKRQEPPKHHAFTVSLQHQQHLPAIHHGGLWHNNVTNNTQKRGEQACSVRPPKLHWCHWMSGNSQDLNPAKRAREAASIDKEA